MRNENMTPAKPDLQFPLPYTMHKRRTPAAGPTSSPELEGNGRDEAVDAGATAARRRNTYVTSQSTRVAPGRFRCQVTISGPIGEFTGAADGPETPGLRCEIFARAAIEALSKAEGSSIDLALKRARVIRFLEAPLVVVTLKASNGAPTDNLMGACLVNDSTEEAAIEATLGAADRWLAWQASKKSKERRRRG